MTARKSGQSEDSGVSQVLKSPADTIGKAMGRSAELSNVVPGLALYQNTSPTAPNPCTYEPSLLIVPQGKKRVDFGTQSHVFGESTFLLTSIALPIVSRVCVASVEKPYLAFFLKLDMGMVRDVLHTEEVRFLHRPLEHAAWFWGKRRSNCSNRVCAWCNFSIPRRMPHSLANYSSARSFIGCCRERRETACVRSQRWQTRAIERLGRSLGCVKTLRRRLTWMSLHPGRDEQIDSASSLSRSHRNEPAPVSKAASAPCSAAEDADRGVRCRDGSLRGWLRKPESVQSGIQAILREPTDAGHSGTPGIRVMVRFSAPFRFDPRRYWWLQPGPTGRSWRLSGSMQIRPTCWNTSSNPGTLRGR